MLVFCVKFNAADLLQSPLVLIGHVVVAETANMSDWLRSIVDESADAFSSKPKWTYAGLSKWVFKNLGFRFFKNLQISKRRILGFLVFL